MKFFIRLLKSNSDGSLGRLLEAPRQFVVLPRAAGLPIPAPVFVRLSTFFYRAGEKALSRFKHFEVFQFTDSSH